MVALTAFKSGCHLSFSPSTFFPSLSAVEYPPSAYDTSQYLLPCADFISCFSFLHLGHENGQKGSRDEERRGQDKDRVIYAAKMIESSSSVDITWHGISRILAYATDFQ
jgi:hypothetical protein